MLAVITFLFTNIFGTKEYWKEIFWPDVPTWLKAPVPMMPLIEFFGIFTKPFALMIRLFANIMAGHAAILSLIAIIFITVKVGPVINGSMTVVAVAFGIFMDALEILGQKKNRIILVRKEAKLPKKQFRSLLNGVLVQDRDLKVETPEDLKTVTTKAPTAEEVEDMLFANKIVKNSKSNAIVLAKGKQLLASVWDRPAV